nr:tyrosine-type recombinase/integrase [uncultured Merdimonas sp.]
MKNTTFYLKGNDIENFRYYLQERESSKATIEKYIRDVKRFTEYAGKHTRIDKEKLLEYKQWLVENYAISSANSMLVALNQFLIFLGKGSLRLKRIRTQRNDLLGVDKALEKQEFQKLVKTARGQGKEQIAMIMEAMCATGIRVSELKFFRVENLKTGLIRVWNKGKYRIVILPEKLRKKLLAYVSKHQIHSGLIFCTRTGREKDRSNIWREMKQVAKMAGVKLEKVFPHNLRHLFARTFYRMTKDLINLADILGHSSVEVTRIYTSDSIDEWRRSLDRMKLLEE